MIDRRCQEETDTYAQRLDTLRERKLAQTREKQEVIGAMDYDDWAFILPPPDRRDITQTLSPSGLTINDCRLNGVTMKPNHPTGGFFGPAICGQNFRALLEAHPVYIDPDSSLAGAYMANFFSYRYPPWNPDCDYSHLHEEQERYQLHTGIGASQHFCQDMAIGLELGWGGLLKNIHRYREVNGPERADFYAGLEHIVLGVQNWIGRHATEARAMAAGETYPHAHANLETIADINARLVTDPPATFREVCQWMAWYLMAARMYNGSGSLGRLDLLLLPYYSHDMNAGILTDEEATFHIACLLLRDTSYIQLGGPAENGSDATNPVSYLVLEAARRLKIPANIGVCVGDGIDPRLLRQGVEMQFADRSGIPKFLGSDSVVRGFTRNGFLVELARQRAYAGCHWYGLPGREYMLMDTVKINFAVVFDVALREMLADRSTVPSGGRLWGSFVHHLRRAVAVIAEGLDFHLAHMHQVFPELVLDLCSYGPIERGLDASHGGVDFYNLGVDGAALATAADSFAAVEQRVEREGRLTWDALLGHLDGNWAGPDGERARLMLKGIDRFGSGGSRADEYARRISQTFSKLVTEQTTPAGNRMIPGLFSWAHSILMGKTLGATPNGRRAGEPISHGASPDPGFRRDGAPTAMAVAVAAVQPGYGNTAPMQLDLDPMLGSEQGGVELVSSLIKTHFDLGGTQINLNVVDAAKIREANEDPSKYPDLIVRVTGFSAYFASLSPAFRQLVVDRVISQSSG